MMFVKICGITRLQDANLAAELGATAIGFIFWPASPRYIAPDAARAIVQGMAPTVTTVGVFVDEDARRLGEIVDEVGLDVAQLHGRESPDFCREFAGLAAPQSEGRRQVIKAIGMKNGGAIDIDAFDREVLILLDAHDPARHGGTGRRVDWNMARRIAASRRTILSGGLNAANVGAAIEAVHPFGIDVSSGVESAPGVKDMNRMRSFFEALNG
jgi:phosphoribosylanthranilate isomerase